MNTNQSPEVATGIQVGNKYENWERELRRRLEGVKIPLTREELGTVGFRGAVPSCGFVRPSTLEWPEEIRFDICIEPVVGSNRVKIGFEPHIVWVNSDQKEGIFLLKASSLPQEREVEAPEKLVALPIPGWACIAGTWEGCLSSVVMFATEAKAHAKKFAEELVAATNSY